MNTITEFLSTRHDHNLVVFSSYIFQCHIPMSYFNATVYEIALKHHLIPGICFKSYITNAFLSATKIR